MTADMYNVQMGLGDEGFGIDSKDRFANEADLVAKQQDFRCVTNSALMCNFYPVSSIELAELLTLVTGWTYTVEDVKRAGERIFTLMRLMNLKLGYDPKNEKLPDIVLRPLQGPTEGHVPDVEAQLKKWYQYRGWDRRTGMPPKGRLQELGLASLS
jgi:aldehyde:ferredoxin oxidoreductase